MALKLAETFKILQQQEQRAATEKNEIGRGLFLKSEELLKQTNELTEEAGIKLAATAYQDGSPVEQVDAQNQTQQEKPKVEEPKNMTALDMIKINLQKKEDEKKANQSKLSESDQLKQEIFGMIEKTLDNKEKVAKANQTQSTFVQKPSQQEMSVVQQSSAQEQKQQQMASAGSDESLDKKQYTFVPHA